MISNTSRLMKYLGLMIGATSMVCPFFNLPSDSKSTVSEAIKVYQFYETEKQRGKGYRLQR